MRKTFGTVDVLRGNQLPGPGRRGRASYKGQLFLEEESGNYYKALDAGNDVEFELVILKTSSSSSSGDLTIVEDPDHAGFALITL